MSTRGRSPGSRLGRLHDNEVRYLATSLGTGIEALVGDLKHQFETSGELTAEKGNQLALNSTLVEALRENIEGALMRSYAKGRLQARRGVESAMKSRAVSDDEGDTS